MFQITAVILHGVEATIWVVDIWYVQIVFIMHVQ